MAYDRYNGKTWTNSLPHRRTLTELPQGTFAVRSSPTAGSQRPPQSAPLRQDVLLEALDTPVLFGAPLPISVTGDFLAVQSDLMGALYLPLPATSRLQYTIYSSARTLLPAEQQATAFLYPEFVRQHYLQVPHTSPLLADLAHRITQSATGVAEAVSLIRTHLLVNYRYSLELPPSESAQPLEDFLFQRKTGYCEHYATAMVILLRELGIPARLVTGFLATEWNDFGNYYTVRQRDAHAWVEVYFPQSGWVTMDPTPPALEPAPSTWWQAARSAIDSIRLKWDRLFVHYNANDQMALVQTARESGDALRARLTESLSGWFTPLMDQIGRTVAMVREIDIQQAMLMCLIVVAGMIFILVLIKRTRFRLTNSATAPSAAQQLAISFYSDMLTCCRRQGITKTPATTAGEFLGQVQAQWSDALSCAEPLTQLYSRVRFGGESLTPEEYADAQQLLRRLRSLRRPSLRTGRQEDIQAKGRNKCPQ
jgi:transglutaminase-like putative cysteine protease